MEKELITPNGVMVRRLINYPRGLIDTEIIQYHMLGTLSFRHTLSRVLGLPRGLSTIMFVKDYSSIWQRNECDSHIKFLMKFMTQEQNLKLGVLVHLNSLDFVNKINFSPISFDVIEEEYN